ncbi:MAG: protein-glutamate O-methyltransferase CheR, partial [Alphaproteobacteria bacterium]|nr:protein-glutamate O-methyltransferase CheR [Alphaproteobacteria bacterium]
LNLDSFTRYLDLVDNDPNEFTNFVNSLTTNLTSFFRESHHFEYLKDELNKLIAEGVPIRIWSAGCSAGMEPYSIAMVVSHLLGRNLSTYDIKILATDIDTDILAKAKRGVYDIAEKKNIPDDYFKKYCKTINEDGEEKISMNAELRNLIAFNQLNLMGNIPLKRKMQIIFCRNVLIYFDKPTQSKIFDKFHQNIDKEGMLLIGHSETIGDRSSIFKLIGKTTYRKIG